MYCSDAFQNTRFARCIIELSGRVRSTDGSDVSDLEIKVRENNEEFSVYTDSRGFYSIRVREGDHVRIHLANRDDLNVRPREYVIGCACGDNSNLNFLIGDVEEQINVITGALLGLTLPLTTPVVINYTVDGIAETVSTDLNGTYEISVLNGSQVVITAPTLLGFSVAPLSIDLGMVNCGICEQNFIYTQLVS